MKTIKYKYHKTYGKPKEMRNKDIIDGYVNTLTD